MNIASPVDLAGVVVVFHHIYMQSNDQKHEYSQRLVKLVAEIISNFIKLDKINGNSMGDIEEEENEGEEGEDNE